MALKYCPYCKRNVEGKKKLSVFFMIITGFIPYLIYYACKRKKCPICGSHNLEAPRSTN